mmetsp:Transcript_2359/g.7090  ORF Transcript_2359/g.7090 Transcript_2359/m.7090 type:complete len:303 (+) Transcript_2359:2-910(+)
MGRGGRGRGGGGGGGVGGGAPPPPRCLRCLIRFPERLLGLVGAPQADQVLAQSDQQTGGGVARPHHRVPLLLLAPQVCRQAIPDTVWIPAVFVGGGGRRGGGVGPRPLQPLRQGQQLPGLRLQPRHRFLLLASFLPAAGGLDAGVGGPPTSGPKARRHGLREATRQHCRLLSLASPPLHGDEVVGQLHGQGGTHWCPRRVRILRHLMRQGKVVQSVLRATGAVVDVAQGGFSLGQGLPRNCGVPQHPHCGGHHLLCTVHVTIPGVRYEARLNELLGLPDSLGLLLSRGRGAHAERVEPGSGC